MLQFTINEEKCTKCGACSRECPTMIIDGRQGVPFIKEGREKGCIKCQHCLAVCPTAALSILGKDPEQSIPVGTDIPDAKAMTTLIKTRRSIRKFKPEILEAGVLSELLETAAYAPTGHNKNQVLLSVTDSLEQRDKVRTLVYDSIKTAMDNDTLPAALGMFAKFQSVWEGKGIDILFRNAPHIIIASGPTDNSNAVHDGVISLSYLELVANTMGLGTLWDGLAKAVFNMIDSTLATQLGIPADHTISYIMIVGNPATKYHRSVQSEGLHLNTISL